jgi:ankyrin repeat protein
MFLEKKLLKCASNGSFETMKEIINEYAEVLKLNLNQTDDNGNNMLHLACKTSNAEMIKFLIDKKISLTDCNKDGETPLLIFYLNHKINSIDCPEFNIVQNLVANGGYIDVFSMDKSNKRTFGKYIQLLGFIYEFQEDIGIEINLNF